MSRDQLLNKLTTLDFMSVDLHLYLDTHPKDKEAIETYNNIVREADCLRMEYEKLYGPLYSFRSFSKSQFHWIDNTMHTKRNFIHRTYGAAVHRLLSI